ncbi:MAG: D-cysteine desulfhydrase family protein [Peptococcaceae bacterium]|nr:D-cysteine desulfhydrase family protein [Peptococcaceae bacterium]
MKDWRDRLEEFPKVPLGFFPTPLHRLEGISNDYSVNLYCKRDDLTGFAFGGNKIRKLEFLLADAKKKNADTIISVGALQSNFCRMLAAAAVVSGFEVHLVLGGEEPDKKTGNLLVDEIVGAKIHYLDTDKWDEWEAKSLEIADALTAKGKRVYPLPAGGSTVIGALGYVEGFMEIMEDCRKHGVDFHYIMHASSSAGTQAGLVVGKTLTGWPGKIIGIGVAKTEGILSDEVYRLATETGKLFGVEIKKSDVIVDNSYMGASYGSKTPECQECIKYFARREGIFLDNVYSGKAAVGVLDYARRGKFKASENVLFLHTGGNIELFE